VAMSQGKRVVLAPDKLGEAPPVTVTKNPDGMTISALLGAGQSLVPPQIIVLSEPEARHLARWLRDRGFLDDGAVESICYHCSGPIQCFNHHCTGGGEPNE
jgi:hypothetical protein